MIKPDSRRPVCAVCLRPRAGCICAWITPLLSAVEVLILQHPLEVGQAKGSARLLHLCLAGSRLVSGETFAEAELQALLHAPAEGRGRTPVLLYPATPEQRAPGSLPAGLAADEMRLVVLDGTWRKSRKMLYQNPLLQSLPRLPLNDLPPSAYLIRKARLAHQMSTLEATCYALMQLEGETQQHRDLLRGFDGFVAQQAGYVTQPPA